MLQLKKNVLDSKMPFSQVECILDCKTPVIAMEYKKKVNDNTKENNNLQISLEKSSIKLPIKTRFSSKQID